MISANIYSFETKSGNLNSVHALVIGEDENEIQRYFVRHYPDQKIANIIYNGIDLVCISGLIVYDKDNGVIPPNMATAKEPSNYDPYNYGC